MRENMWYVSFCAWLILLNTISSSSIHLDTNERILFCLGQNSSPLYTYPHRLCPFPHCQASSLSGIPWLLWMVLRWTWGCRYPCGIMCLFPMAVFPKWHSWITRHILHTVPHNGYANLHSTYSHLPTWIFSSAFTHFFLSHIESNDSCICVREGRGREKKSVCICMYI